MTIDQRDDINIQSSRVTQVVEVRGTVGNGHDNFPFKAVRRYYTVDGLFIGKLDENDILAAARAAAKEGR